MRNALIRYRVMAYTVGTMLVVLVFIGIPLQVWGHDDRVEAVTGVAHGWLYMIMIITAIDLGRRAHWSLWRILGIVVSGLVPFVTFVAEHYAAKDVKAKLAAAAAEAERTETVAADPQA